MNSVHKPRRIRTWMSEWYVFSHSWHHIICCSLQVYLFTLQINSCTLYNHVHNVQRF